MTDKEGVRLRIGIDVVAATLYNSIRMDSNDERRRVHEYI